MGLNAPVTLDELIFTDAFETIEHYRIPHELYLIFLLLRPHTLNSTSMSKAYQSTFTGEINTPYSKQFVHSKSSQYRRLKTEWKNNVYLARSRIQGLGLYAAKDLEKHTMVIEYIGTIIRNEVANRREKIYEEQVCRLYLHRMPHLLIVFIDIVVFLQTEPWDLHVPYQ